MIYRYASNGAIPEFNDRIRHHENLITPANYVISGNIRQAILASVLGDGYLSKAYKGAATHRITWNMGNELHAKHKADFFSDFGATYKRKQNPGFGKDWHCVVTKCHPSLTKIYNELYDEGKRKITQGWVNELDALGWAWLYGDDGSIGQNDNCFIHCEGYGEEVAGMYCNAINDFTGTNGAKVASYIGGNPKKERFYVRLSAKSSDEFMSRVQPHMAPGTEYKIRLGRISRRYR